MKRNRQKSKRNILRAKRREAQGISNLFPATLQAPFEVELGFHNCSEKQKEQLRGHWVLGGTVSRRAFAALGANAPNGLAIQLIGYPTPSGAAYAILAGQLGNWQCRLMFALYDSKAIAFLTTVMNEPFKLRLTSEDDSIEGLIYECNLPPKDLSAVGDMCVEVDFTDSFEVSIEAAIFIDELMHPLALPTTLFSGPGKVRDVDVSVLFPGPISEWSVNKESAEEWV